MGMVHLSRMQRLAIVFVAVGLGCGPRQAVVTSDPNPAARTGVGNDVLMAELVRLQEAQAAFRRDNGYYASTASALGFAPVSGVRVDMLQGDRSGWSATAASGDFECAMYEGQVRSPRGYLTTAGNVACR